MNKKTSRLPFWVSWAVMLVLMLLTVHVVVETAVQLFFDKRSGISNYLSEFREKAKQANLSLGQYSQKVGLDPYLGWGREEVRQHEPPSTVANTGTVLFVGDSVTAGHDVRAGEEDYPALLSKQWGQRGIKVVNLAARGYGVDQMWLKLLLLSGRYHPDAIVFAYIPHDLLRPASDYNFGLTKPKFQFSGLQTTLNLAQGMEQFQAEYASAKSGFHLSSWFAGRYWDNREYYLPVLAMGYFDRIYRHIGEGLAQLSHEQEIPIVVAKLTNYRHFRGFDQLVVLAKSGLVQPEAWAKADVRYFDTDDCVLTKANALKINPETEFAHHPSPQGHRLIAECLGSYMEPVLLKAMPGSVGKGKPE